MLNQDVFSVGAVAGIAIAIIFTWRIFVSAPERRQPKRHQPNVGTSSGVVGSQPNAAVVVSSSGSRDDSRARNVVDDFFQPVKVTCRLVGVVLEETSPEELQKKATVRSSVLEVLLEITKFCDLYFMDRVLDDESEVRMKLAYVESVVFWMMNVRLTVVLIVVQKRVLLALEEAGVFTSGGLVKDKVLFCSTENGRTSFVRQLEPDWHIDTNPDIISQLARFIRYQLHISPSKPERTASNVFSATSLEEFFGCTQSWNLVFLWDEVLPFVDKSFEDMNVAQRRCCCYIGSL
ncbi:hypothetical protein KSS87_006328 [Heliosperma pusillum]|nr:hypothetical protein KSS87_006328 [Heliosperma pusillum]